MVFCYCLEIIMIRKSSSSAWLDECQMRFFKWKLQDLGFRSDPPTQILFLLANVTVATVS